MTSSASRGQSKTRECNSLRKTRFLISQGAGPLLYAAVVLHQEPERQFESTRSPSSSVLRARDTGMPGKTRSSMDHSGYGISEFESYMPSQPVKSLRRDLHGCRKPRHSGRLGGMGRVSGPGFTHYRRSIRRFSDAGLCSVNFNIRTGRRETGSIMGRDRFETERVLA